MDSLKQTYRGVIVQEIKDAIRQFILVNYLPGEDAGTLGDDTPLQTSGILDSLAALKLVSFVEEKFLVELDVYETSPERFNRIKDIAASIASKKALSAPSADISR